MAHSISAKKRVRQNEKRRLHNRGVKSRFRSQLKKVLTMAQQKAEGLQAEFRQLCSWLDKAAVKRVIHRNAAARYKATEAGLFVLGAAVGAGVALLLAPRAGKDLWHTIRARLEQLTNRAVASLPVKARRAAHEAAARARETLQ